MRHPTSGSLVIAFFWVTYGIFAVYALYEDTPPLSRMLMLVLCGYTAIVALLTFVVLRRKRRNRSRTAAPAKADFASLQ